MITVLTPTGARPEAFAACVTHMQAQTYSGAVRWVVVDDGPEPMPTPRVDGWSVVHIRRKPYWQSGQNTQARNILTALKYATDRVVIVEDDDSYAPWWVTQCTEWLMGAELVGESHSLYRHTNGAEKHMGNANHASLCSTALRGAAIDKLREICTRQFKGIDLALWREFNGPKKLHKPDPRGVIGIKGLPGRPGIGMGHRL